MQKEITESVSSQGKINPRLRSTQRVRAVPYESCGGLCSFLNSGCFSMCCGAPKLRRRSSVHKSKKDSGCVNSEDTEVSELPKRLIIPNEDDGITDEDQNELNKVESKILNEPENIRNDVFIMETDIELDKIKPKNDFNEEKDSAFSMNEDNLSNLTDNVSVTDSETSSKKKKGKKNLLGLLNIGKKGKSKETISTASSMTSISQSEKGEVSNPSHDISAQKPVFETCVTKPKSVQDEESRKIVLSDVTSIQEVAEPSLTTNVSNNSNLTEENLEDNVNNEDLIKGQDLLTESQTDGKNQNHSIYSQKTPVDESDIIKLTKTIPLGTSVLASKAKDCLDGNSEGLSADNISPELNQNTKKKPFWKPSFKKDKSKRDKKEDVEIELEKTEESLPSVTDKHNSWRKTPFLRKLGSLKRAPAQQSQSLNNDNPSEIDPQSENENETGSSLEVQDAPLTPEDELGTNDIKKRTLFGTLKLSRKPKSEKKNCEHGCQQKCTQMPCLLGACVNSNINPTDQRKNSSDSIEVQTIASYEGEPPVKNEAPITIIRSKFFPAEVHQNDSALANSVEESAEVNKFPELKNDDTIVESLEGKNPDEEKTIGDITKIEKSINSHNESIVSSPEVEKKYDVIEKEDFSDSLHTIVDNQSAGRLIISTTEALSDNEKSWKSSNADKNSIENSLPDGIFRTTYDLSVEGSVEKIKDEPPKQIHLNSVVADESVLTSTETLTELKTDDNILVKSTETLTESKNKLETSDWIDVSNIEDLSDSKFNYIYKTTLNGVNGEKTSPPISNISEPTEIREAVEQNESTKYDDDNTTPSENSCEICGNILNNDDFVAGQQEVKCVCTTLTKPRDSITELEEDDTTISEAHSSPTLGSKSGSKSATPSPIAAKSRSGTLSSTNSEWQNAEEDIDRMMVIQGRTGLSGLGLRSDSMASVYSGAGEGRYGTVTVRGQVEFGLQYNYKAGALEIHIKQCKDLAPVDIKRNRSDPYVKVYLLPDKSKGGKRKTKVKKHTLNPVFDETLKFHISLNGLETRTLWLTVWHSDMFGRNDFLGEVRMALENKVFDDPTPKLYNLQERTEPFDDSISFKGDIIVCLKFVPPDMTVQKKGKRSRGTLHVMVKEAKYLTAYKANGTSDPFCKSYLLPDKGRNSKQKTPVIKKTVNPVWNHTFVYDDVTLQELAERCLELTVWDHDRLASNEFLGGVRFSLGTGKHYGKSVEWMDATGKEMTLWKSMLERPNFWVEGCLSLRPTLDARTS